jgi:hypothetical protein
MLLSGMMLKVNDFSGPLQPLRGSANLSENMTGFAVRHLLAESGSSPT